MGVITLALVAYGSWTDLDAIPVWVKWACALTIAAGTYLGGWRIIRTLGKGLIEISSPQGMAAETASAAIILSSSHLGMARSTPTSPPVPSSARASVDRVRRCGGASPAGW
jgi:PiT family inorganic phosphate transporter